MSEVVSKPAVALLFADAALGAHLRDALTALGARIVHEGAASEVTREALAASGADVVVVNLEPSEVAYLERLYDVLAGGSWHVIFNDAEASRNLSGWDRARWARHLAAKLVGSSDVDPPRPADARAAPPAPLAATEPIVAAAPDSTVPGGPPDAAVHVVPAGDLDDDVPAPASTDAMAAELEQLLAGVSTDEPADEPADEAVTRPDEPAPREPSTPDEPAVSAHGTVATLGDTLELAPDVPVPVAGIEERQTIGTPAAAPDWGLVDFDAPQPASAPAPAQEDSRDFGVEKVRAEDYLAPDTTVSESPVEPANGLELVSLEESIAPTMYDEPVSEMLLGEGMDRIRRVVVIGVGAEETAAAGSFLASLPASLPAVVLIVQHQQGKSLDEVVAALDVATDLPVRVAREGTVARPGQAWLVPSGQTCRLARSGAMKLESVTTTVLGDPSIDECLAAIADTFDADVTAIVLAGSGYDALAGAQEVHDRGGRVWVQDPSSCGNGDMPAAIQAEGLAAFSGTPEELAGHLAGEYA